MLITKSAEIDFVSDKRGDKCGRSDIKFNQSHIFFLTYVNKDILNI